NQNRCWNSTGSPPRAGSKMPMWKARSRPTSIIVTATTGVPRIMTRLAAEFDQMNSGKRNHLSPGAGMVWMGRMDWRAGRIEQKGVMKRRTAGASTQVFEYVVE